MTGNMTTLIDLAAEVEKIEREARDFVVPQVLLEMPEPDLITIMGKGDFRLKDHAHSQLASRLGIPAEYYSRMKEIPGLRERNVNAWLLADPGTKRMIRTQGGKSARAILSDRYRPMDNGLVLRAMLPAIDEVRSNGGEVKVLSQSLTDSRMYLQVLFPRIEGEVKVGDTVQGGVSITNSEVGLGTLTISSFIFRLACQNGMVIEKTLAKRHIGRRIGEDEGDYSIYRNDTMEAEMNSLRLRLRDTFFDLLKGAWFHNQLNLMRRSAEVQIMNPEYAVEEVIKYLGLPKEDKANMMLTLGGESNTIWGLTNSLTAMAHRFEDPDRAYSYEQAGYKLLDAPSKTWERIAA